MEPNLQPDNSARAATAGGTLLVLLIQISAGELLKTGVLAAVGAVVSFSVSQGMKWVVKKWRNKRNGKNK